MSRRLALIVAVSKRGDRRRRGLPWHPEDPCTSKEHLGHAIIMGRATWDSLGAPSRSAETLW